MKYLTGNILACKKADAICVTTNGTIRANGALVMGKGLALAFKEKFEKEAIFCNDPENGHPVQLSTQGLDVALGDLVDHFGNHVYHVFPGIKVYDEPARGDFFRDLQRPWHYEYGQNICSFPTKNHWRDDADIKLILRSCRELVTIANANGWNRIALPRPGCSLGNLKWEDVEPVISKVLDDRFYIITQN